MVGTLVPAIVLGQSPQRVVSMNLCTDQLAMLLAGEGQLASVSAFASDPVNSAMAEQASSYPANYGRAEEIHLLNPDLVVTSRFSTRTTVDMLRRLDVPVEVFEPAASLGDIRDNIRRMGRILDRTERAEALVAAFDRRLAMLNQRIIDPPRAALYFPNGYTRGEHTLLGDMVQTAGFRNVASAQGVQIGAHFPLEQLVLANPDVVITGSRHSGRTRSEEILEHPALLAASPPDQRHALVTRDWVCGTPQVLAAIERIGALRGTLVTGP